MPTSRLTKVALATAAATTLALGAGAGAAQAAKAPLTASGNTVIQLNNQTFKALTTNGCGDLSAVGTGNGVVKTTGARKVQVTLPVTGVVLTSTGHARIEHAGSGVELSNSCYDVRLTNLYVQDLGSGQQYVSYDVLAKTISDDEDGSRQLTFHLDGSMAQMSGSVKHGALVAKIMGFNVLLGDEGADEFNQLATGSEQSEGSQPFSSGQLVGKARTTVRVPLDQVIDDSGTQPAA